MTTGMVWIPSMTVGREKVTVDGSGLEVDGHIDTKYRALGHLSRWTGGSGVH